MKRENNGRFLKGFHPKTEFKKGDIPWNKNKSMIHSGSFKKGHKINIGKKHTLGRIMSEEEKAKRKAILNSPEVLAKFRKARAKRIMKPWSEEQRTKFKIKRALQILPKRDTKIEVKIQDYLKQLQIGFFTHYYCSEITHSYQCDILIPVQRNRYRFISQPIIIECDGDAFHFNPIKYNKDSKIFKNGMTAQERWNLDNLRTKELKDKGFKVIRLWERDIKNMIINNFNKKLMGKKCIIKN